MSGDTPRLGASAGFCDVHHKDLFPSKRKAKRRIRRHHDSGMRAYRCTAVDGFWHVGHLAPAVKAGLKTASEVYGGGRDGGWQASAL